MADAETPKEASGGKGKQKMIILILLVVNVLTLGGLGAVMFLGGSKTDASVSPPPQQEGEQVAQGEGEKKGAEGEKKADEKPAGSETGSDTAEPEEEPQNVEGLGPVTSMGSMVINLTDAELHYLKVSMQLEVTNEEVVKEMKARDAQLRDITITYLSSLTVRETQGAKGKERIRRDIAKRFNTVLTSGKVKRIFFGEFVAQ